METKQQPFRLGLTMAGAVSAGAYTAGVMDYLIEALDAWEKAKGQDDIPSHDVLIDIMCGASAGGITSIVAATGLRNTINPITADKRDDEAYKKENILYNTWVNLTNDDMMEELLSNDDIDREGVFSLLNADFKDELANRIFKEDQNEPVKRSYLSDNVEVMVSLSNLTGIKHYLGFESNDKKDNLYITNNHRDFAHFIFNKDSYNNDGKIPVSFKDGGNLNTLKEAVKATGAFPIGLAPRYVERPKQYIDDHDYLNPHKLQQGKLEIADPYVTLNVDGGMMNNEPFDITQKYLLEKVEGENHTEEGLSNFGILMIDPFPSEEGPVKQQKEDPRLINKMIGKVLSTMMQQLLYKSDDFEAAYDQNNFSRFLIAPTRSYGPNQQRLTRPVQGCSAIACGALGGFSGFFDKSFREHDFYLGRRNCQRFLQHHFVVPADTQHPIFKNGYSEEARKRFTVERDRKQYIPIIPDVKGNEYKEPKYEWPQYDEDNFKKLKKPMRKRLRKVLLGVLNLGWFKRILANIGIFLFRKMLVKKVLKVIEKDFKNPDRPLIK